MAHRIVYCFSVEIPATETTEHTIYRYQHPGQWTTKRGFRAGYTKALARARRIWRENHDARGELHFTSLYPEEAKQWARGEI